ncbi:MAG: succinylglutamate desuccinylase/aspartoacylase family protein [Christensenellales bacterium]
MSKSTEYMKFAAPEGREICFPVATVKGNQPGPCVVITAGIHGCEYPGIAAAIALFKELEPAKVNGTVRIVTVTSIEAFEKRNPFVCPVDGKNPNRFFPGDLNGTYTDIQAYHYLHDLLKGADYHLDLHGGDLVEALEPFSLCHAGASDEVDRKSFELALYYGLPNMVKTTWDGEWKDSGTTYANAAVNGIPSVIVEAGGIGQLEQSAVNMHLWGLHNVLRHVGVLDGKAVKPEVQIYPGFKWMYTPWRGIFYKRVSVGDTVDQGQVLGTIENYFGEQLGEIKSTVNGKVVFLTTSPAMTENGLLMGIAYQ